MKTGPRSFARTTHYFYSSATRAAKHAGVISNSRLCLTLIENIGINLPIDIVGRNWRSLHSHRARHQEIGVRPREALGVRGRWMRTVDGDKVERGE